MKPVALMTCVLAASVMPTATAQIAETASASGQARAYVIRVEGDAIPSSLKDLTYPTRAASRGRDGHCDLLVQIEPDGSIGGVAVQSCSSADFEKEASRVSNAGRLTAGQGDLKPLRIEWEIDQPR